MQNEQTKLHRILSGTTAEHVTLAPQPPADCDRLTTDARGVYLRPPVTPDLWTRIVAHERNAYTLHGPGSYGRTHLLAYATNDRAALRQAGRPVPPPYEHPLKVVPALTLSDAADIAHLGHSILPAWEDDEKEAA